MFAGKKSAQIREILISESAWEEMTCLFAPSLSRIIDTKKINSRVLTLAICAFIVITLTIWVSFRVSVLVFFQLGSPLYGIVSCLIPFFLIYKVAQLEKLRGFKAWLILLYGILLCLSPLLKLIE